MEKEFWRKAPQCNKCIYHCLEGRRPDSIDPESIWKEACPPLSEEQRRKWEEFRAGNNSDDILEND